MGSDLQRMFREAEVVVAYLFGSRASGRGREASDADVAVLADRTFGLLDLETLADRLRAVLDVPDVDVVDLDTASLELRGRVIQEGRVLFSSDEPRRVAFEVRTRSEYLDFLPTLERMTREYLRRVAERGL